MQISGKLAVNVVNVGHSEQSGERHHVIQDQKAVAHRWAPNATPPGMLSWELYTRASNPGRAGLSTRGPKAWASMSSSGLVSESFLPDFGVSPFKVFFLRELLGVRRLRVQACRGGLSH